MSYRKASCFSLLEKAIHVLRLFETKQHFNRNEIAKKLGTTPQTAYRWIDALSMIMPIAEYEVREGRGKKTIYYYLTE